MAHCHDCIWLQKPRVGDDSPRLFPLHQRRRPLGLIHRGVCDMLKPLCYYDASATARAMTTRSLPQLAWGRDRISRTKIG